MSSAASSGRALAGKLGILAEFLSSAGFILDDISMDVDFRCCKCDEDKGEYVWVDKTSSYSKSGLMLSFKSRADLAKLPQEFIDAMVGSAQGVVAICKKLNE